MHPTQTAIRTAQASDIPELASLLGLLFTQEADFEPHPARQSEGLRLIIANPGIGQILVATAGERIVGMISLLYTISTALGGRVATLEDMVVAADYRGCKIGTMLLHSAVSLAKDAACKRITLLTDLDNTKAIGFYRKHGFVSSAMTPLRLMLEST